LCLVRATPSRTAAGATRQGDPLQQLRIAGVKVKPVFDLAAHTATEANEGLLPWNGKEDNLIDRFDGRALLDFYREPPPRAPQPKTDDELELEQKV
jgi:arginine/serine-rich splicing factor 16